MKIGDKVVCIDDQFDGVLNDQGIRKGEVYTVSWVGRYSHIIDGDYNGIRLAEISRGEDPAGYCEGDLPFFARRFKPVVSPKTERVLETAI